MIILKNTKYSPKNFKVRLIRLRLHNTLVSDYHYVPIINGVAQRKKQSQIQVKRGYYWVTELIFALSVDNST